MYVFIVNELAGGGKGRRIYEQLRQTELFQSLNRTCHFTKGPEDATKIMQQIVKDYAQIKTIVVIGGDGTFHEVINGLDDQLVPVSLIPSGSGNDFSRGFGISGRPLTVLEKIVAGTDEKPYYFGEYIKDGAKKQQFINCIGFGFDAKVVSRTNKPRLRKVLNYFRLGRLLYVIALLQALIKFKPFNIDIELDGKKKTIINCWMVTITNHPYFGGGMKIIPGTKIEPTYFPVLVVHSIPKWKVLLLFITVFTGKHLNLKGVDLYKPVENFSMKTDQELLMQVDGELKRCQSCQVSKQTKANIIQGTGITGKKIVSQS